MEKKKRNTKTKQMIISVFNSASSALCHEDIEQKLTGKIDRVTIYRILNGFCDEGRVHKIAAENGKIYYALCKCCSEDQHNDNHPHFKCLQCGEMKCINEVVEVPTLPDGYLASSLLFTVSGYCKKCLTVTNEIAAK
jgi:Fe2+ or Zn2+ uptake regulation protein